MNDHDAMTAINAVLDRWLKDDLDANHALIEIAKISGANTAEHEAAK